MDATMHCNYQDQDSAQTLREGLAEYYRANPDVTPPDDASSEGARFFASHDVAHVIFGTTTRIIDETVTDLWQLFGLDISAREYARQGLDAPEIREIFKQLGLRDMLHGFALIPRYLVTIWRRTRRMTKPWPWTEFGPYLDQPLADIRREFGIEVLEIP